jgi:hypothetical protein
LIRDGDLGVSDLGDTSLDGADVAAPVAVAVMTSAC